MRAGYSLLWNILWSLDGERERERESLLIVVAVRELALSVAPKLARAKESIHTYSLFLSSLHEPDDLVSYHPRDRLARRNAH